MSGDVKEENSNKTMRGCDPCLGALRLRLALPAPMANDYRFASKAAMQKKKMISKD